MNATSFCAWKICDGNSKTEGSGTLFPEDTENGGNSHPGSCVNTDYDTSPTRHTSTHTLKICLFFPLNLWCNAVSWYFVFVILPKLHRKKGLLQAVTKNKKKRNLWSLAKPWTVRHPVCFFPSWQVPCEEAGKMRFLSDILPWCLHLAMTTRDSLNKKWCRQEV